MKKHKQILLAPLCILWAVAMILSSCMSEVSPLDLTTSDQGAEAEGVGYFEVNLQGSNATRATKVSDEEAKKYIITIYKGTDLVRQGTLGEINTRLDAGYGYSLTAESCSEADAESLNDGWGKRRYMGRSQTFAIIAGKTIEVPVTCKVANGGISAYFDKTITDNFSTFCITIDDKFADGKERKLEFSSEKDNYDRMVGEAIQSRQVAYFNIPEGGRTIQYTVTAGSVVKTFTQELEVAKIKRLSVSYKSGEFTLVIDVEDEDVYADDNITIKPDPDIKDNEPVITTENIYTDGELVGTTLTATDPSYYVGTDLATEWSAVVKDGDGNIVRTLSAAKGTLTSGADDAQWPYLPKGNYTFEYIFENFKGIEEKGSVSFKITDEPQFQVSLNALTSYSYATGDGTEKNISWANNNCSNSTIYAPTVTVTGISDALAQNPKYGLATTFNGETKNQTKTAVYADLTSRALGTYTLSASATFAGLTLSANKTVYITGIPYESKPPSTSNGWTKTNGTVKWENDHVRLGNWSEDDRIAKSFYVPSGRTVDVSAYFYAELDPRTIGTTFKFYIGGEEKHSYTAPGKAAQTAKKPTEATPDGTLTTSNMTVECYNSYGGGAYSCTRVYEVNVYYR